MNALRGKAVVITGAARGLGAAYARLAAAEGARVVLNDINATGAEEVAQSIRRAGGEAAIRVADIASWKESADLMQFCVDRYGSLDGLVNNAALFYMALPEEETEARVEAIVRTNVIGNMYCGIHALRHMVGQGGGSLVNVTSGAHAGYQARAVYGATKGATASLTYGWACDMVGKGVRVNAISPMARSQMGITTADYYSGRGEAVASSTEIEPEDNAAIAIFLLSDAAAEVHGQVVRIDGRRLSLTTHPAILNPPVEREHWTFDDVRRAFETELGKRQLPLGMVPMNMVPAEQ